MRPVLSRRTLASRGTLALATLLYAPIARGAPLPRDEMTQLLRGAGHIAFMRHAWAPFEGAPKGERGLDADDLGPCETQRNLDDFGRKDARRIGEFLRAEKISFDHVYTSKWCRCRETAELIMGRPVEVLEQINSYFSSPRKATKGPAQLAALKLFLNQTLKPEARALMVTHGSLITDLCGIDTGETEIVVVKADGRGGIVVIGHGTI
jgi:phosphohistidine phosphatase SixA